MNVMASVLFSVGLIFSFEQTPAAEFSKLSGPNERYLFFDQTKRSTWQEDIKVGSVIGEDDLVFVGAQGENLPDNLRSLAAATGWTNYGCTVSHVGGGYAISAGHCFEAKADVEESKSCRFVRVHWDMRKQSTSGFSGQCQEIIAMKNGGNEDFAILKIHPYPKDKISLDLSDVGSLGEVVSLLSHPDGRPLMWSQYCELWDVSHPRLNPAHLKYGCDTSGGSSGALILRQRDGVAIGIHKGGYPETNYGFLFSGQNDFLRFFRNLEEETGFR